MTPKLTFNVVDNPTQMIRIINHFLTPAKKDFDWSYVYIKYYPEFGKHIKGIKDSREIRQKSREFFQKFFKENKNRLEEKRKLFQETWEKDGERLLEALSEILEKEWPKNYQEVKAWISLNPICPRFLEDKSFEVFWDLDENQMKRVAIHELLHFLWFEKWKEIFPKCNPKKEFESPNLVWKLSEIVPKAILGDKRIQEVFPHEPSVYNEWKTAFVKGKPVLEQIQELYDKKKNIEEFMKESYTFLKENKFDAKKPPRLILPKSDLEKQEILSKIAEKFKTKKDYSQIEVDEILQDLNVEDFILFRRELINFGYLGRDNLKGTYWLIKTKLSKEELKQIEERIK